MAGAIKKTTGLAGIAVEKRAHEKLILLYNKILKALDKLPEQYPYRQHTLQIVQDRANIVRNNNTVKGVEEAVGCGQIEELILQAQNELALSRKMLEWKPWEPLIEKEPPNQWSWPPQN